MAGPLDKPIYTPQAVPATNDAQQVAEWTFQELITIAKVLGNPPGWYLTVSNVAPTRPRTGLLSYADGTHWNPGSGEGLYVYKSTGWKFVA